MHRRPSKGNRLTLPRGQWSHSARVRFPLGEWNRRSPAPPMEAGLLSCLDTVIEGGHTDLVSDKLPPMNMGRLLWALRIGPPSTR